jgi:hypothetical protein
MGSAAKRGVERTSNLSTARQRLVTNPPLRGGGTCRDGSGACLSPNPPKAFCARDGVVREARLELVFSRVDVYEDKMREVYPQGATGISATARNM